MFSQLSFPFPQQPIEKSSAPTRHPLRITSQPTASWVWVIAERLDYLWFLGYGLEDEIPDHRVLSKARARWGKEVFESLFVQTVGQCWPRAWWMEENCMSMPA